jgi:hypothetical protein
MPPAVTAFCICFFSLLRALCVSLSLDVSRELSVLSVVIPVVVPVVIQRTPSPPLPGGVSGLYRSAGAKRR